MAVVNSHDEGIRVLVVSVHLQIAFWGLQEREDSMT